MVGFGALVWLHALLQALRHWPPLLVTQLFFWWLIWLFLLGWTLLLARARLLITAEEPLALACPSAPQQLAFGCCTCPRTAWPYARRSPAVSDAFSRYAALSNRGCVSLWPNPNSARPAT